MKKMSSNDRQMAVSLRLSGYSLSQLALKFGVTRQRIAQITPTLPLDLQAAIRVRRYNETCTLNLWSEAEDKLLRLLFVHQRKAVTWIVLSGQLNGRTVDAVRTRIKKLQLSIERSTTPYTECHALKLPELLFLKKAEAVPVQPQVTYSHITASLMGDPSPQRSALYTRTKQDCAA